MAEDGTLSLQSGLLANVAMRYHELAMQRWCYSRFYVIEGYPVPVVFSTPMDAYSHFNDLWKRGSNPFAYLMEARDANGTPLYLPHPAPARYPLISIYRRRNRFRTEDNFSMHRWRRINWPTVNADVKQSDLGTVSTSYMPMGWSFDFQLDFWAVNPATVALFTQRLMWQFFRTGGNSTTWIEVIYPPPFGPQTVKLKIDGDSLEHVTEQVTPEDEQAVYRVTVNLVLEGYLVDLDIQRLPALWTLIVGNGSDPVTPDELDVLATADLRVNADNPTLESRDNVPSNDGVNEELAPFGGPEVEIISLGTEVPQTADPSSPVEVGFDGGVSSEEAFGLPVVSGGS